MSHDPDFLIIGAAKAGTTALFDILRDHPAIYLPEVKEPHHFAFRDERPNLVAPDGRYVRINDRAVSDRDEYRALFASKGADQIAGEASVSTLFYGRAAAAVAETNPAMKLIAVLRSPADRAYSSFNHARRWGLETEPDFDRALDLEPARIEAECPLLMRYVAGGRYAQLLQPFYDRFDPNQIHLIRYEDYRSDVRRTLGELLRFLGVDPTVELDVAKTSNVGAVPTPGNRLHAFLTADSALHRVGRRIVPLAARERLLPPIKARLFGRPEPLDPLIRQRIVTETAEDVTRLHELTGLDCLHWIDTAPHPDRAPMTGRGGSDDRRTNVPTRRRYPHARG